MIAPQSGMSILVLLNYICIRINKSNLIANDSHYLICRSYFLLFSEISGDFGEKPVKLIMPPCPIVYSVFVMVKCDFKLFAMKMKFATFDFKTNLPEQ